MFFILFYNWNGFRMFYLSIKNNKKLETLVKI